MEITLTPMNQNNSREVEQIFESKIYDLVMLCGGVITTDEAKKAAKEMAQTHHQELQKARHEWLREEIDSLEYMKNQMPKVVREPFELAESVGAKMAIDEIIDRHQSELDQLTSDKNIT